MVRRSLGTDMGCCESLSAVVNGLQYSVVMERDLECSCQMASELPQEASIAYVLQR